MSYKDLKASNYLNIKLKLDPKDQASKWISLRLSKKHRINRSNSVCNKGIP